MGGEGTAGDLAIVLHSHMPYVEGFGTYPFGIYCRASLAEHLDSDDIFNVTKQGFAFFESRFGVGYPFGKYDQLFVPEFNAGAMENAGCVTHHEDFVFRSRVTDAAYEQRSNTILHELAHMWFGDLVTMKWWNGIWLNEAFATFMEIACCDAYRPDWLRWTTFSLERSMAFEVDSLASTRTVEFPVEAPDDCDGMFDVLTYQKGGSLLRMLQQYLGEEAFQAGVAHYLTKHSYGNTETSDLWDAIEEANPSTPVRRLMDSWIWQAGYPLVSARLDGSTLVLGQQRYAFGDTDDATLFVVPVVYKLLRKKPPVDFDQKIEEEERAVAGLRLSRDGQRGEDQQRQKAQESGRSGRHDARGSGMSARTVARERDARRSRSIHRRRSAGNRQTGGLARPSWSARRCERRGLVSPVEPAARWAVAGASVGCGYLRLSGRRLAMDA